MQVGFVGLGNVGGKLAGSLLRNAVDVSVLDLNPDLVAAFVAQGAQMADSPAELMRRCDVVITCLPTPRSLWRGRGSDAARGDIGQDLDGNVDH